MGWRELFNRFLDLKSFHCVQTKQLWLHYIYYDLQTIWLQITHTHTHTHTHTQAYIYIYICIYIYISLRKTKNGHIKIIDLFPSCCGFLIYIKNTKRINRTSSDLMDKIIQNRHRKEDWEDKKTFNNQHLDFPGKELNVTDIHNRMEINL